MTVSVSYPGVYIDEVSSGVRTIAGVSTSIALFAGWSAKGATDAAVRINNFTEFEREFGGLDARSLLGYSVKQFFGNGGGDAYVLRIAAADAVAAQAALGANLTVDARSSGGLGESLQDPHDTPRRARRDPLPPRCARWQQQRCGGRELREPVPHRERRALPAQRDQCALQPDPRHGNGRRRGARRSDGLSREHGSAGRPTGGRRRGARRCRWHRADAGRERVQDRAAGVLRCGQHDRQHRPLQPRVRAGAARRHHAGRAADRVPPTSCFFDRRRRPGPDRGDRRDQRNDRADRQRRALLGDLLPVVCARPIRCRKARCATFRPAASWPASWRAPTAAAASGRRPPAATRA